MFPNALVKKIRRWDRKLAISKRQQLVLVTLFLTAGLLLTQMVSPDLRYPMVILLSVLAYAGSAWGLREDLDGVDWLMLLTLPTLYTGAVALFYFLLPVRWLTRLPIAALYAVGMYALLLTENIYNVAANRSIALLRAAHSVGFLLTLVTYFLLIGTILSFRFPTMVTAALVALVSGLLTVQSLWCMLLENHLSENLRKIAAVLTAVFFELAWIFAFWPIRTVLIALFLTIVFYSTVGMAQQYVVEKLYRKTVIEFASVTAIVFILLIFATHWRGNL